MLWSIERSVLGSIPCFFKIYSKTISRHASCASAENLLAFQAFPLKIILRLASHQEVACTLGQLGEVHRIVLGTFLVYVDAGFGAHKTNLGVAGDKGGHNLISTGTVDKGQVDAFVLKVAQFNGCVLGGVEDGMGYLVEDQRGVA